MDGFLEIHQYFYYDPLLDNYITSLIKKYY